MVPVGTPLMSERKPLSKTKKQRAAEAMRKLDETVANGGGNVTWNTLYKIIAVLRILCEE